MFQTALAAAANHRVVHEKDVIPRELVWVCSRISRELTGEAFRDEVKKRLPKYVSTERDQHGVKKDSRLLSREEREEAERFIDRGLHPLLTVTKAFADFLAATPRCVDSAFVELLRAWEDACRERDPYQMREFEYLFRRLGLEAALFALWARDELKPASVEKFLAIAHSQNVGADTVVQIVSILAQREALHVLAGEQAQKARAVIQAEDDVMRRASLFVGLGRAVLPASVDDASAYFRDGLEQMDAIGSGDYQFTNELLLFASAMKGDELDERDFHTLTNLCELNMGGEPEKFFWGAFARGLSKTAGARGLAKLSRWDDRSKIRLSYTLLPYLTALVDDGKIEPELALALNRLEHWRDGTAEFAKAIEGKGGTARPDIVGELIKQFEDDNPGVASETTVEALASLAERTFGKSSETTTYLSAAHRRFAEVRRITNEHRNYRAEPRALVRMNTNREGRSNRAALRAAAATTDPIDQASLAKAVEAVNELQYFGDSKSGFFASLRRKYRLGCVNK